MQTFKSAVTVILLSILCLCIPPIAWSLFRIASGWEVTSPSVTYAELVTIILASVTVSLTVLTFMIAFLAFWGFSNIKDAAKDSAKTTTVELVTTQMTAVTEGESFKGMVLSAVKTCLERNSPSSYPGAFPPTEENDQTQPVAAQYPGGDGDG